MRWIVYPDSWQVDENNFSFLFLFLLEDKIRKTGSAEK